jgi:GNAT superfamily N-acetyltransferase
MRVPVNVRLAVRADAPLVSNIHVLSRASAYRGLLPDQYLDNVMPAESAAFWPGRMARLEAGAGVAYLAERDGAPIGFVCLERPDQHGSVCVDNLHAFPEHKGRGAGSALLDAARNWALARAATRLHLLVLEGNTPAVGFYESRGWRLAAHLDDRMGGIPVVMLRYELPL